MYIDDVNKNFLDIFFENHMVWHTNSIPWQYFNVENGKRQKDTNIHTRTELMFSEYGFFNEMVKELESDYLNSQKINPVDFSYLHRQRRYIVQSFIQDGFNHPTHHSFKVFENQKINFDNPKEILGTGKMCLITHPGHTRFESSAFLKRNLNNALIYVNKNNYYEGMFEQEMERITNISDLVKYWKPLIEDYPIENSKFDFTHPLKQIDRNRHDIKNYTKFHNNTECNVLKLWSWRTIDNLDLLHTPVYVEQSINSGKDIAQIWDEIPFTIYTNSEKDIKKHFKNKRKELVDFGKLEDEKNIKKHGTKKYYFDNLDKFKFNVIVLEQQKIDENVISTLNDHRGFAVWIDDSIVEDIDREVYEFLFFARADVKVAKTFDDKILVVNCKIDKGKTWKIHNEFYL